MSPTARRPVLVRVVWLGVLALSLAGIAALRLAWPGAVAQELPSPAGTTAQPDTPSAPTTLGEDAYLRIQGIRERLALRRQDLASYGLNEDQAEGLLSDLLAFTETHRSTLDGHDRTLAQKEAQLRRAYRDLHTGQAGPAIASRINALQRDRATAQTEREALIDSFLATAQTRIPGQASTRWQTARNNPDLPDTLRYVSLSSESDRRQALDALRRHGHAAGLQTLDPFRRQQALDAQATHGLHITAVTNAEHRVLPAPPSLGGNPGPEGLLQPADPEATTPPAGP